MADFEFYGSRADGLHLLRGILQKEPLQAVACVNYPDRRIPRFTELSPQLEKYLEINRRLFLLGRFSVEEMQIQEMSGGPQDGTFAVDWLRGGPLLEFVLPPFFFRDGFWHVGVGRLGYHNEGWSVTRGVNTKASPELKAVYLELRGDMRRELTKTALFGRSFWIGKEAKRMLDQNQAFILNRGWWCDVHGRQVKSNQ